MAKTYCEEGRTNEAAATLGATWDSLLDDMAGFNWDTPTSNTATAINDLVMTICLRDFLDRVQRTPNRRTAAAMLGRLRSYLEAHIAYSLQFSHLLCVVTANLADDLRLAGEYREADKLFEYARAHVTNDSPTGAVASLMQGLMWLEAEDRPRAEHHLIAAGKVIVSRPTPVSQQTQALLATILLYICRNDFGVLDQVLGLPKNAPLPPTNAGLLTQLNASWNEGPSHEEILRMCYVPLCAALG